MVDYKPYCSGEIDGEGGVAGYWVRLRGVRIAIMKEMKIIGWNVDSLSNVL